MRFFLLLWVVCGCLCTPVWAQPDSDATPAQYGIRSKKALKLFLEGKTAQRYREHGRALQYFDEALALEPTFAEARVRAGIALYNLGDSLRAYDYLSQGLQSTPPGRFTEAHYFRGKVAISLQRYEEASQAFGQVLAHPQGLFRDYLTESERLKRTADFAAVAIRQPVNYQPENLGPAVNTQHDEYMPTLPADASLLFFTSQRPENMGGYNHMAGMFEEDFYVCQRQPDGTWAPARNLGPPINTDQSEGASSISGNGRYVVFAGCDRPDGMGNCDLYMAEYDGARWGTPRNLRAVNSPFRESYPCLNSDGSVLFFESNRPGGVAGGGGTNSDIWVSYRSGDQWTRPVNVGNRINTSGVESSPFLAADDRTLYFSSDGQPGFGGMDNFKVELDPDSGWGTPQNLGYPLNTAADERYLVLTTDGSTGYINSNRRGGLGGIDIYKFMLDERIRPRPATFVRGLVRDSLTQTPIGDALVYIQDLTTRDTVRSTRTLAQAGTFLASLPLGRDYAAFVDVPGYAFASKHFHLSDSLLGKAYFDIIIDLQKLVTNTIVRLDNIFFDFDKATLKPESEVELNKLLTFMQQNTGVRIELRGHTDDRGTDDYNRDLSQRRATAVLTWLTEHGVAGNRLTAIGFGESIPVAPNSTDEGRAQNRRTEFRIVAVQ
jgi:outer membrane protein OmpA-like peptidoglycan-associated protein/tetratricopeptide (TPR) repeat protein